MTAGRLFDVVIRIGLELPNVEASLKYDGSPVLKLRGCFVAGLAMHPSAEPDTVVVRIDPAEREDLLADAPETYYVTDYYRPHPVVLARLRQLDRAALKDLLMMSWRLTGPKTRQ
jgi:hypothetical protein